MLWLKAFHIVFVVAWFVGFFALPRLFVYHVNVTAPSEHERFVIMERRMFGMMTFAAVLATAFAVAMLIAAPGYLRMGWLHAKLAFVLLLYGHHIWCYRLLIALRDKRNTRSQTWYRVFNELPFVALIAVVVLATVKPF